MSTTDHSGRNLPAILRDARLRSLVLALVVLAAIVVRLDGIRSSGHLVEREYNSAIFARAFYFDGNESIEAWRQENARATRDLYPALEPPVTEYLLALVYRATGREEIWFGHILTSAFWLIGAFFLHRLAREMVGAEAAVFATGIYLLTPWGVIVSRSVQPDALMMMMFTVSWGRMIQHVRAPSDRGLVTAGALVGLTILLRPLVAFALAGAFVALVAYDRQRWHRRDLPGLSCFALLSVTPSLIYYGYGILVGGELQGQAALSFRPHLLVRPEFWERWIRMAAEVSGLVTALAAAAGFALLPNRRARAMFVGALLGYCVFAVVFTYHTITHPYYHVQLVPLVAVLASAFWIRVVEGVRLRLHRWWWVPVGAALALGIGLAAKDVREESRRPRNIEDPRVAREIGALVGHSQRVVMVARHYGLPLEYHGEFAGLPWPVRIDDPFYRRPQDRELSVEERLDALAFVPEYFVITDRDRYARVHQDLAAHLQAHYEIVARTSDYEIHRHRANPSASTAESGAIEGPPR